MITPEQATYLSAYDDFCRILCDLFVMDGSGNSQFTLDSKVSEFDPSIDALDMVELCLYAEEQFGIKIDGNDFDKTVLGGNADSTMDRETLKGLTVNNLFSLIIRSATNS